MRRFFSNVRWSVLSAAAGYGVTFFTTVLLARVLEPTGYGAYRLLLSFLGLASLMGGFELRDALRRFIPATRDRPAETREILRSVVALAGASALLVAIATLAGADLIAERFYGDRRLTSLVGVSALIVVLAVAASTAEAVGEGFERFRDLALRKSIVLTFGLPMTAVGAVLFGLEGAIAGLVAYYALYATVLVAFANRLSSEVAGAPRRPRWPSRVTELLRFALPTTGAAVLIAFGPWWANTQLAVRAGYAEVGFFTAGAAFVQLVATFFAPLGAPLIPMLVDAGPPPSPARSLLLYHSALLYLAITAVAMILFRLWAGEIVELVYGASFTGAAPVLAILGMSLIPKGLSDVFRRELIARGRTRGVLAGYAAGTATLLLLLRFSHPGLTAVRCAWAFVLADTAVLLILAAQSSVRLREWATLSALGVGALLAMWPSAVSARGLRLLESAAMIGVLAACCWRFGLSGDSRARAAGVVRSLASHLLKGDSHAGNSE